MKKLFLALTIAFGASMVACGGGEKAADNAADSTTVEATEVEAVEEAAPVDSATTTEAAPVDSATTATEAAPAEAGK